MSAQPRRYPYELSLRECHDGFPVTTRPVDGRKG